MTPEPVLVSVPIESMRKLLATHWSRHATWLPEAVLPRALYQPEAETGSSIVVLIGSEDDLQLLAHEYGHHLGERHPLVLSRAWWFDIMGYGRRFWTAVGLKHLVTDERDVLSRGARAWLAARKAIGEGQEQERGG